MTTWINDGSGVPIGYANGSRGYKAGDIGRSLSLCQRCIHRKPGPVTISENITISGESSYCDASGAINLFENEAVIMCSKFQEGKKNED